MASIEKRGVSWRITISDGTRQDGTRKKVYRTLKDGEAFQPPKGKAIIANNKTNVETIAKILEGEVLGGTHKENLNLTVKEYLEEWLNIIWDDKAGTTRQRYKELIDNYVAPKKFIGGYQLQDIKPKVFIDLYKKLQKPGSSKADKTKGLSGTTVLQIHRILHRAFTMAVTLEYLDRNPLVSVDGPTKNKPNPHGLTEEQAISMLDRAYKEEPFWFFTFLAVAVTTGLRRGELLALRWADLNLKGGWLKVNQSLQYIKGEGISTKEPKTEESKNPVPVPSDIIKVLEKWEVKQVEDRVKAGSKWKKKDLVFPNWCGDYQHPDNVTHLFKEFIERIGLPEFHLHNLRHTTATILINKGVQAKSVQGIMRHATLATTTDTYTELFEETKKKSSNQLSGIAPKASFG